MKPATFHSALLNFGYAEDASIAYIPIVWTGKPFTNRLDAIVSMAEHFKRKWMGDPVVNKVCCSKYKNKNYCADCGRNQDDNVFDMKDFVGNFLKELPSKTTDSYGLSWDESQEGDIWTPDFELEVDTFFKTKNILILISAEKVFALALENKAGLKELLEDKDSDDPNVILG